MINTGFRENLSSEKRKTEIHFDKSCGFCSWLPWFRPNARCLLRIQWIEKKRQKKNVQYRQRALRKRVIWFYSSFPIERITLEKKGTLRRTKNKKQNKFSFRCKCLNFIIIEVKGILLFVLDSYNRMCSSDTTKAVTIFFSNFIFWL